MTTSISYNFALATVDNGTREGLDKFLKAASSDPDTVLHYEFMQDYKVGDILFCFVDCCAFDMHLHYCLH